MILLGVLAIALASGSSPEPKRSPLPSSGPVCPAPGSLAMGSPERALTASLGKPSSRHEREGFQWRTYRTCGATLEAGFYNDKFGRAIVRPDHPLAWPQAQAWAQALAPKFTTARLHKDTSGLLSYFETISVAGIPFEVELRFTCQGERVRSIEGSLSWLD